MSDISKAIEEYGGVQPPHFAFYMESIRFHAQTVMVSIDFLVEFIEMTNTTKGHYQITGELQTKVLDHIQRILTHAAALSRYFWPSRPGKHKLHEKRAETLRSHFGLTNDSPLKNRDLRNYLEHFDENLDNYLWAKPIVGYVIPAYVGGETKGNGVPAHLFKAYYIDSGVFETLGVRHEVQPIVDELCNIYGQLHDEEST